MDDSLYFSEQHLAVRNMVREFARTEVAPVAAELDAKAEFPWANVKKMGELGLLGIRQRNRFGSSRIRTERQRRVGRQHRTRAERDRQRRVNAYAETRDRVRYRPSVVSAARLQHDLVHEGKRAPRCRCRIIASTDASSCACFDEDPSLAAVPSQAAEAMHSR